MFEVDKDGYYGKFGGAYIPEMLYPNVEELRTRYLEIINSDDFKKANIPIAENQKSGCVREDQPAFDLVRRVNRSRPAPRNRRRTFAFSDGARGVSNRQLRKASARTERMPDQDAKTPFCLGRVQFVPREKSAAPLTYGCTLGQLC